MNFIHRNRLISWALLILVIINLSALVSFFLFTRAPATAPCCTPEKQQCMAFSDELNLTEDQTLKVSAVNKDYREAAEPIATGIKQARKSILNELEKENSDSMRLDSLTHQLALLQIRIQKENIRQYLALKHVCNAEQANRLSALYHNLYGCPMEKGRMQHRNRHGQDKSDKVNCE